MCIRDRDRCLLPGNVLIRPVGDTSEEVILLLMLDEAVLGVDVQHSGGLRHGDVLHEAVSEVGGLTRGALLFVKDGGQDLWTGLEHSGRDVAVLSGPQAVSTLAIVTGAELGWVDACGKVVVRGGCLLYTSDAADDL